jgi:sugar phosphate isomerase/epimerase
MAGNGPILYSRREFGRLTLAGLPLSLAFARIDSRINGVQVGVQSYSFRTLPDPEAIIKAMVDIGIGEVELMSNHAEALAGAPGLIAPGAAGARGAGGAPGGAAPSAPGARGGGRAEMTPEQKAAMQARVEELRKWRTSTSAATWAPVRKKFDDAGIELRLLCYNMNRNTTDDEIEYGFQMAQALGVKAISTSTQVSVAKRVAPFADKHQMMVGYHGHSNLTDPDEFAKPESFAAAMEMSKYHGINLDIGHFVAANYDPIAYIQEHHDRITNLHLKDRKKDQGANVVWGEGDTPIKPVLKLVQKNRWDIPANIEFEYPGDAVTEVGRCYQYCKDALA